MGEKTNIGDIKVSIWCLSYNHEKYIRKTLDGFVKQKTNFKFEVIVHDDASTDGSAVIIKEYEEKYPDIIRGIYQTENQYSKGKDFIKNYIYPKLKGKYFACCEGDDYWCDEFKLQRQFDALEKNPQCCISTHLVECCNEDGSKNMRVIPEEMYNINKECILTQDDLAYLLWEKGGYPFHTSSYFIRRSVYEKILEGNWTKKTRDIDIMKASLLLGDVYYIDRVMSVRRLWSIGNWNSRLREGGVKALIGVCKDDLECDAKFDSYSEYKFHDKIAKSMIDRCFFVAVDDVLFVKKYIKENNLRCDFSTVKDWCKYLVLLLVPSIFKLKYWLTNQR